MVFSEYTFLFLFLPLALSLHFATPVGKRHIPLALVSYVFYGWVRYDFCLIMLGSTLLDYVVGRRLENAGTPGSRKLLVALSLVGNLGLLAYFKYRNFGVENWNAIAEGLSWPGLSASALVLPVGISFYTFQSMSYTLDVYRGDLKVERNLLKFAAYISMFPQLVAGPIVRLRHIREDLERLSPSQTDFARGVFIFMLGLSKKVLIADNVALFANTLFDDGAAGAVNAWGGLLAYTLQIYFDFSGYSDMAIGLGHMLGVRLPVNFESPYKASSITDFWRRWHITLSSWFRDYLYIPLGGNRNGRGRNLANLVTVFFLCGLWHGAEWTFVIWGLFHGLLLVIERLWGWREVRGNAAVPRRVLTLLLVMIGWVFFRAPDFATARVVLADLFGASGLGSFSLSGYQAPALGLTVMALALPLALLAPNSQQLARSVTLPRAAVATACFWLACTFLVFQEYKPFLYFQF